MAFEHRVSDNRGKWLVINFWATWCTPCLKEMPELERFYQDNKARAEVWGVTFEDSDIDRNQILCTTGWVSPTQSSATVKIH